MRAYFRIFFHHFDFFPAFHLPIRVGVCKLFLPHLNVFRWCKNGTRFSKQKGRLWKNEEAKNKTWKQKRIERDRGTKQQRTHPFRNLYHSWSHFGYACGWMCVWLCHTPFDTTYITHTNIEHWFTSFSFCFYQYLTTILCVINIEIFPHWNALARALCKCALC